MIYEDLKVFIAPVQPVRRWWLPLERGDDTNGDTCSQGRGIQKRMHQHSPSLLVWLTVLGPPAVYWENKISQRSERSWLHHLKQVFSWTASHNLGWCWVSPCMISLYKLWFIIQTSWPLCCNIILQIYLIRLLLLFNFQDFFLAPQKCILDGSGVTFLMSNKSAKIQCLRRVGGDKIYLWN